MDNLEVKRIRESLGLTQQQLAKSCGVSVRFVQNWEAGSVAIPDSGMFKLSWLTYLVRDYCVSADWLLLGLGDPLPPLEGEALKKAELYRRRKTARLYSIKLEPEALELINCYRGVEHLLSFGDAYKDSHAFCGKLDRGLKSIGLVERISNPKYTGRACGFHREAIRYHPQFPFLSIYWARHTWASVAAELDIPVEVISHALGMASVTAPRPSTLTTTSAKWMLPIVGYWTGCSMAGGDRFPGAGKTFRHHFPGAR